MSDRITARRMAMEPPCRRIKVLRTFFPYRGDKLPYTTDLNLTAGEAVERMIFAQKNTGYHLTYTVTWEDSTT